MAAFAWMLVEGLLLWSKVVAVNMSEDRRMRFYYVTGWGLYPGGQEGGKGNEKSRLDFDLVDPTCSNLSWGRSEVYCEPNYVLSTHRTTMGRNGVEVR